MAGTYTAEPERSPTVSGGGGIDSVRAAVRSGPRGETRCWESSNVQEPILAMRFGFCTSIQNQLAVLTGLALDKNGVRFISDILEHTCILLVLAHELVQATSTC